MSTDAQIEQRLSAVEAAVAELRQRLTEASPDWIERLTGSMTDYPEFDEVLKCGRAICNGNDPIIDNGA